MESYAINHTESEVVSRLRRKYSRIANNYESLDQVQEALVQAGLESSNLIVGIDFTKSNEWTGQSSFNCQSLHHIGDSQNPYEQAISIIGRTLSGFDEDDLIPCFGFGDASTHEKEVFSFFEDGRPCTSFEEALCRYREIVPRLKLSGPTSFAPIIETAIGIVEKSRAQYHVLLIITDGQVTRGVDSHHSIVSPQERDTIDAIVKASDYPLSIVLVGVDDGPWDMMHQFDDNIPPRAFDNFQFVNFTGIMAKNIPSSMKEVEFAMEALMEIPSQYKATIDLHLLSCPRGTPVRVALPPPLEISQLDSQSHPYSDHIHGKPIPRYDEQVYIVRNDQASGQYVTTGNILVRVGSRRTRGSEDSMTNTMNLNDNTLILSFDDGVNDARNQSPAGNGNNSANTQSTVSLRKRMRTGHPCDNAGTSDRQSR